MLNGKVLLIDYVGQSNDQGEPVGHSLKTLEETAELLDQIIKVEFIIPHNYEAEFRDDKKRIKFFLEYHSSIYIRNFFNRLAGLLGKTRNLMRVFRQAAQPPQQGFEDKETIWWFIHPDFLLFVFLFFYPFKIRNKIMITMYMEGYDRGSSIREKIKHYFFKRTIGWVDFVIKNSEKINVSDKELFCPDFLYREDKYRPFPGKRKEWALCPGVMNRAKDIKGLVTAWSRFNNTSRLKIAGFFPDKNLLNEIKKYENENIEISDCYLAASQYYQATAEAKFLILPYLKSRYNKRTSGILLESIYLDTPVIAPHFLLEYTGLPGFGYDKLNDIESILTGIEENKLKEIRLEMKKIREAYSFDTMKTKIKTVIECLRRPKTFL